MHVRWRDNKERGGAMQVKYKSTLYEDAERNRRGPRIGADFISKSLVIALVFFLSTAALAQTPESIFDELCLHDVYIEMAPDDWRTLRDNYLLDDKYDASFVFNGLRYA